MTRRGHLEMRVIGAAKSGWRYRGGVPMQTVPRLSSLSAGRHRVTFSVAMCRKLDRFRLDEDAGGFGGFTICAVKHEQKLIRLQSTLVVDHAALRNPHRMKSRSERRQTIVDRRSFQGAHD